MIQKHIKQGWRKWLIPLGLSLAFMPFAGQATVYPDTFNAVVSESDPDTVTLDGGGSVSVNFNLDVTLQYGETRSNDGERVVYEAAFSELGETCNEFWDVGVDRILMIAQIENANCQGNKGCKLIVTNVPGNVTGMIENAQGIMVSKIPNGYSGPVQFDMTQVLNTTNNDTVERTFDLQLQTGDGASITLALKDGEVGLTQVKVENTPLADTLEELNLVSTPITVDASGLGNGEPLQEGDASSIEISTIQVPYAGKGNSNGKPNFLLISGVPGSKYMYRNMIPELAKIGNVVAYDRPGLGESEKVINTRVYGYSLQNETDLIAKIVNQLGIADNLIIIANENGTLGAEAYVRTTGNENVKGLVITEPWVDACQDENNVTWESDFRDPATWPPYYIKTNYVAGSDPANDGNIQFLPGPDGRPQVVYLDPEVNKGLCSRGFTVSFWGDEFGGVLSFDAFKKEFDALTPAQQDDEELVRNLAKRFSILTTWTNVFHDSPINDFGFGNFGGDVTACVVFMGAFGVYLNDQIGVLDGVKLNGGDNFGGISLLTRTQNNNNTVLNNTLKYSILNTDINPGFIDIGLSDLPLQPTLTTNPFANPLVGTSCFNLTVPVGEGENPPPQFNPLTRYPRTIPFPADPARACGADGTGCPVPASNDLLAANNAASMAADEGGVLAGIPRLMLLGDTPEAGGTFIYHPTQIDYARDELNWTVQCVGQGGHMLPDDAPINMMKRIKQWGAANNLF